MPAMAIEERVDALLDGHGRHSRTVSLARAVPDVSSAPRVSPAVRALGPLFLLVAAIAQAQPAVGPEVVWRTTSPAATLFPAPQAARIAPDRGGFVAAWSEVEDGVSRAYAGRLDLA